LGKQDSFTTNTAIKTVGIHFQTINTRYLRILIKNFGKIPAGNPGAGTPAWLFVDEIEVN
jgi:hexosaminidase